MITLTKTGPGLVELTERPERSPGPGEVRLDVIAAGVCGTDLHIAADEYANEPPVTMGHEISGVVAEVGPEVDPAWCGRRVACETYYSTCESCPMCRAGRPNLCPRRRSLGSFEDGGFAPSVVLPARNLHPVPDSVGGREAVLFEPLACVTHCLDDPGLIEPGDEVLVTGPGAMGLLSVQVARAAGAVVTCAGLPTDRTRLGRARELGAEVTTEITPEDYDVVVECSGAAGGIAAALGAVRRGGRYVQVGIRGQDVSVPWDLVLYRELTVTSGFASTPTSWRRALRLVESGAVDLDGLVSHALPLDEWRRAFDLVGSPEAVKVVLEPKEHI